MKFLFAAIASVVFLVSGQASVLKSGDAAPLFKAQNQDAKEFDLASRKGHWTVLYFYPKDGTPGCTRQAITFRDNIEKIRSQGADVFGVSTDSVERQAEFHKKLQLNFSLLSDPEHSVIKLYGSKMPILNLSKRWTFILDPELKIRMIQRDVDPVADTEKVADKIAELKSGK
jgi:peroxiredoxin Q/BCP